MYGAAVAGRPAPSVAPTNTTTTAGADRAASPADRQPVTPLLPAPAAPPTLDELNAMLAALSKVPFVDPAQQPAVTRLDDDWLTKGNCLGRYGRYWGCWCAICSPNDYIWGTGPEKVEYAARIGPRATKNDLLRYWIQWLHTMNPNSLEMPPTYCDSRVRKGFMPEGYTRRQAEWDDHGEAYPMSSNGPGLYCTLKVPDGLFYLSLYDFNKDGHVGWNRFRDFRVSVRPHAPGLNLSDIEDFSKQPDLAHGRIRDFWGGVYERYLVRGPTEITVEVDRNHSFCTILAGVFLDLVEEEPLPYFHSFLEWEDILKNQETERLQLSREPPGDHATRFRAATTEVEAARRCFGELERMRLTNSVWWATQGRRFYIPVLRGGLAILESEAVHEEKKPLIACVTTCYYQLSLFGKWEAGQARAGEIPSRQVEKSIRWDGVHDFEGKGFLTVTDWFKRRNHRL
jgi:hypothetical protein